MNRLFGVLLFSFFLLESVSASDKTPSDSSSSAEFGEFARGILSEGDWSVLAEASRVSLSVGRSAKSINFSLGTYWQPDDSVRFGVFFRRTTGLVYSEDWINSGSGWRWKSVGDRAENQIILDASPRRLVSISGDDDTVLEFKFRFVQSDLFDHRTLILRPALMRPILRDGKPWLTLSAALESDVALSGAGRAFDDFWAYLGGSFRVSDLIDVGLNFSLERRFWDDTEEFRNRTGERFTLAHTNFGTQFGMIFRL
jgi:hypothetical protein